MNRTRATGAAATLTLAAIVLAGCAASDGGGESDGSGETLTLGISADLQSWAPQDQSGGPGLVWLQPVYDTLLLAEPDGTVAPMLATDWTYSNGNKTLELDLRDDVTFTDGTAFTADAVKVNLEANRDGGGPLASGLKFVTDVTVVDDDTVQLELSAPDPYLITALTRPTGAIASPELVASGEAKSEPVGTGPYIYDAAQSTVGSEYVFTANPDYWDASRVKFGTIVYKPITDATASLNALQSGQIEGTIGDTFSIDQAKSAGLTVTTSDGSDLYGLYLLDRDGTIAPQLADARVRQAMNLVFDRQAITDALYAGYGVPTSQIFAPGSSGWVPDLEGANELDIDKAKSLLSEAGYPDGFSISMPQAPWFESLNPIIEQQLALIGITVQWTAVSSADVITASQSGDYPMIVMSLDDTNPWRFISNAVLPTGAWNVFQQIDPDLQSLIDAAQVADEADQPAAYQAVNSWMVEDGWMVPLLVPQNVYFSSSDISVEPQFLQINPSIYNFAPAS